MGDNFASDFAHGSYLLWDGGSLKFDLVTREQIERDADITTHPVEQGVDVADHYRRKMRAIKLDVFVSQEPLDPTLYGQQGSVRGIELQLPSYPLAMSGLVGQAIINPFGQGARAASQLFASAPTSSFQALAFDQDFDALAIVQDILDSLYQNATLVDVATRSRYFANHLLGPTVVTRDKDSGTGATISLELREVRFVSTQKVGVPPLPAKPKDKPSTSKGQQQPVNQPQESTLHYLGGKATAAVRSYFAGGGA